MLQKNLVNLATFTPMYGILSKINSIFLFLHRMDHLQQYFMTAKSQDLQNYFTKSASTENLFPITFLFFIHQNKQHNQQLFYINWVCLQFKLTVSPLLSFADLSNFYLYYKHDLLCSCTLVQYTTQTCLSKRSFGTISGNFREMIFTLNSHKPNNAIHQLNKSSLNSNNRAKKSSTLSDYFAHVLYENNQMYTALVWATHSFLSTFVTNYNSLL